MRRLRRLPAAVGYLAVGGLTGVASLFAVVALAVAGGHRRRDQALPAWPEQS